MQFLTSHFVLLHLEGNVWDDQCDHYLEADYEMLKEDAEDDDIAKRPRTWVLLLQVLDQDRLFFKRDLIKILRGAYWDAREAANYENEDVARN